MKNLTVPLPLAAAAVLITGLVVSIANKPANVFAQGRSSYAEDRAAIEDLQARYLFALDFHDPDLYVSTFTEDGVFDGFGHYEDDLVKVNGRWLFTKRKIYNEGRDEWAYKGRKNPAW